MKTIQFEYGNGLMAANLPDSTDIFIPGETVKDPDYIPESKLESAYKESLANPMGMPTLTELVKEAKEKHPGKPVTVVFVIPDRVKGGEQATSHRKLAVKYMLDELYAAGVQKKDVLFIISNGLHPRSTEADAKAIADLAANYGFTDTQYHLYHMTKDFRADEYLSLLRTYPDHMKLEAGLRSALFDGIYQAIIRNGGTITVYYTMDLELARKPGCKNRYL